MLFRSAQEDPSFRVRTDEESGQTMEEMAEQAHCYYEEYEEFDEKAAKAHLRPAAHGALTALRDAFETLESWSESTTQSVVEGVATALDLKLGKVAQPLRVALTGTAASPGIGVTLVLVGRERTLRRIDRALLHIEARSADERTVATGDTKSQ